MDQRCPCGVDEGQLHCFGCQYEPCPFCEERLALCDCYLDFLGLRSRLQPPESHFMSQEVYEKGLTAEQVAEWEAILTARGRLPHVYAPQLCGRCGQLWPPLFVVQDVVWDYYTGPDLRDAMLCEPCFHEIRRAIDKYQPRPPWLPSAEDIETFIRAWRSGDLETLKRLDPRKFDPGYSRPRLIKRHQN
jgi:hypothetical protein